MENPKGGALRTGITTFLTNLFSKEKTRIAQVAEIPFVGAGGLSLLINEKIGWREYDSVGMLLIVLLATVLGK